MRTTDECAGGQPTHFQGGVNEIRSGGRGFAASACMSVGWGGLDGAGVRSWAGATGAGESGEPSAGAMRGRVVWRAVEHGSAREEGLVKACLIQQLFTWDT